MLFNPSNFLAWIKNLVTGGGVHKDGTTPYHDSGYLRERPVPVEELYVAVGLTDLVDNSGGAANGTVDLITLPTTLTDNGGGAAANAIVEVMTAGATITDNSGGVDPANNIVAVVTPAVAITDNSGGVDPANNIIAVVTNATLASWNGANHPSAAEATEIITAITAIKAAVAQIAAKVNTDGTAITALKAAVAQLIAKVNVDSAAVTAIAANFKEVTNFQAANRAALSSIKKAEAEFAAKIAALNAAMSGTAAMTLVEVNALAYKIPATINDIGHVHFIVPRDYDEATDTLKIRVLADMVSVAVDTDVQLDAQVYVKHPGSALSADKNPTKPTTILSATAQWLEFCLSRYGLKWGDVVDFKLITDGHNDTAGEEVCIRAIVPVYRSTLVSYNERDSSGNDLR